MWAQTLTDCNDPSDFAYCTCAVYSCGYSQPNRKNISPAKLQNGIAETDCSAGVSWWLFMGRFLDHNPWFHTAIERDYLIDNGFMCFTFGTVELERNDVLLREAKPGVLGHTALYIGDGLQAEAVRDENHDAGYEGTIPGDQDGGETVVNYVTQDWDYVLRKKYIPNFEGVRHMTFLFTCDGKNKGHVYFYDGGNIFLIANKAQQSCVKDAYKKANGKEIPFFHLADGDHLFMVIKQKM